MQFGHRFVAHRWKYFSGLRRRWPFVVVAVIWAAWANLRALPDAWQKTLHVAAWVPAWPWYVWVIVFLVIFISIMFEAAFQNAKNMNTPNEGHPEEKKEPVAPIHADPAPPISPAVIIHNNPSFSQTNTQTASPNITAQSHQDVGATAHSVKKRVVTFSPPRFMWLRLDSENGGLIWRESADKTANRGLVLPIYNDPTKSEERMEYARVHLTFTNCETRDKHVVGDAWWVDENYEDTELRLGDQKYIILVIAASGTDNFPEALSNTARTFKNNTVHYNDDPLKSIALNGKTYDVEACLIHGGGSQFKDLHRFTLTLSELIKQP